MMLNNLKSIIKLVSAFELVAELLEAQPVFPAAAVESAKGAPAARDLQLLRGPFFQPHPFGIYPTRQSVLPAVGRIHTVAQTATNQIANTAAYSASAIGNRARFANHLLYNGATKVNDMMEKYEALKAHEPSNEVVQMLDSVNTAFRGPETYEPSGRQSRSEQKENQGGFGRMSSASDFQANFNDTDEIRQSLTRTVPPENRIVLDPAKVQRLQVLNSLVGSGFNAALKFMGANPTETVQQDHQRSYMSGPSAAQRQQAYYPRAQAIMTSTDQLATAAGASFAARNYQDPTGPYGPVVHPSNFPVIRDAAQNLKETKLYDHASSAVQVATGGNGFLANRVFTPPVSYPLEKAEETDEPGSMFMSATSIAQAQKNSEKREDLEAKLDKFRYSPKDIAEIKPLPDNWTISMVPGRNSKTRLRRLSTSDGASCKLSNAMLVGTPYDINVVKDRVACEALCEKGGRHGKVCDYYSYVPRRSRCYQFDKFGVVGSRDTYGVISGMRNCNKEQIPKRADLDSAASGQDTKRHMQGASVNTISVADSVAQMKNMIANNGVMTMQSIGDLRPSVILNQTDGLIEPATVKFITNINSLEEMTQPTTQKGNTAATSESEGLLGFSEPHVQSVSDGSLVPVHFNRDERYAANNVRPNPVLNGQGPVATTAGVVQAMTDPKYAGMPLNVPFMRQNPPVGSQVVQAVQPQYIQQQATGSVGDQTLQGQSAGPGFASTAAMLMQAGTKFMQLIPIAEMAQAGYQLYKSGFLRNRGMNPLRGSLLSRHAKEQMAPPQNMASPTVRCLASGMTCCAPKEAGELSRHTTLLNGNERAQCVATYTAAEDAVCATVGYNNPDTCGMRVLANGGTTIYQNRLKLRTSGVNDIICQCSLTSRSDDGRAQYEGQAVWEYEKEAMYTTREDLRDSQKNAQKFAQGATSALSLTQILGEKSIPGIQPQQLSQVRPTAESMPYQVVGN